MSAVAAFNTTYVAALTKYFGSGATDSNRTELDTAKEMADQYLKAVSAGFNPVILNKLHPSEVINGGIRHQAYVNTLYNALMLAKEDVTKNGKVAATIIENGLRSAAIAFWTGAMLEGIFKGMPPGHVGMSPSVIVTDPGVVPPIKLPTYKDNIPILLPQRISAAYVTHMSSIKLLVPAMILPPPASPYPLPLIGIT